jgi:hypothetical protein
MYDNVDVAYSQPNQNFDQKIGMRQSHDFAEYDEEEVKRREEREKEDEERKNRLREKLTKELEEKQDRRDKAQVFLEEWKAYFFIIKRNREKMIQRKNNENKDSEQFYLQEKLKAKEVFFAIKKKKTNPWDTVISNITMKDSEYKGTKDVSRMRTSIINRKNDLNK